MPPPTTYTDLLAAYYNLYDWLILVVTTSVVAVLILVLCYPVCDPGCQVCKKGRGGDTPTKGPGRWKGWGR